MLKPAFLALVLAPGLLADPGPDHSPLQSVAADEWCRDDEGSRDLERYCEVRESSRPASGRVDVDASPNGGITVRGSDRPDVQVRAKVVAVAETEADARALASEVQVETTGTVRASGPSGSRHRHWSVSYQLSVPRNAELSLRSVNGGISAKDVTGSLEFETTNGGVTLEAVAGRVHGRTTNGGVSVRLGGAGWTGEGLDVVTTNGGVSLALPADYNARVETGTTNGHLSVEFPITLQGRIDQKHLSFAVGHGGPLLRAVTTNGGVDVHKR